MSKMLIVLLIIGLFIVTTACTSKTSNTGSADVANSNTGNNGVVASDSNVAASNNDVASSNNVAPNDNNIDTIASIKSADNLNKTFTVEGIVVNNVKIGSISGYRLKDATDSIPISSQVLAPVNSTVKVTGVLHTSSFFGFYLAVIQQ